MLGVRERRWAVGGEGECEKEVVVAGTGGSEGVRREGVEEVRSVYMDGKLKRSDKNDVSCR